MIHGIHKPDTVIFRRNIHDICIQVKWHLICEDICHLPFFILKNNLGTWVYHFNASAEIGKRIFHLAAVEHYHIRIADHIHEKGFHVLHVNLKCACIHTGDVLLNAPALGKAHFLKFAYQPHSIVFHNHTLRLVDNIKSLETLRCKLFFLLNNLYDNIVLCKGILIIFFLTLFAENKKCFALCAKIILLQGKAEERGLAAFQESGYEINRYCNFIHVTETSLYFLLSLCYAEKFSQLVFLQFGTDHAETSCVLR